MFTEVDSRASKTQATLILLEMKHGSMLSFTDICAITSVIKHSHVYPLSATNHTFNFKTAIKC